MRPPTLLTVVVLCALPLSALQAGQANTCSRSSANHTVALVELYTSEGCSSCPPADRWLRTLSTRYASDRLLPLALHVDYWDDLGWRDPYAQPSFTQRQRQLGRLSHSTIYTPGVFAGMRELLDWRDPAGFDRRVRDINRQPARAAIALTMLPTGPRTAQIDVSFALTKSAGTRRQLQAVLVIYEDQLVSDVARGENRGATLRHDHVVRYWSQRDLDADNGQQQWRSAIELPSDWNTAHLGVAAFVQDAERGEILQAVSMPTCL